MLRAADQTPGSLEVQIVDLLSQVTSDLTIWSSLREKYEADIFCGMFMAETNEGADLSPGSHSDAERTASPSSRMDVTPPIDE